MINKTITTGEALLRFACLIAHRAGTSRYMVVWMDMGINGQDEGMDEEVELEDVIEADGQQIGVVAYEGEPSEDSTGWREAICEALEIAREQRA